MNMQANGRSDYLPTNVPTCTASGIASNERSGSSNTAAIGAGVGVTLGVILAALIALYFYRRKKRHSRITDTYNHEMQRRSSFEHATGPEGGEGYTTSMVHLFLFLMSTLFDSIMVTSIIFLERPDLPYP